MVETPIFINNRNHYTYLRDLIEWLDKNGFTNYYVVDNDSAYPPLLDYYENQLKGRVIFLHRNVGHLSFWKEGLIKRVKNSFYIYTDSDILPVLESNPAFISDLYDAFKKYSFALKAGSAIKIDDLPDCYSPREDVVAHEKIFWKHKLDENVYHSTVDTTLALYLPNFIWNANYHWDKHIRVAGHCLIRHQPWYLNTDEINEEQLYYRNHAATATHWTNFEVSPSQ
ncbi:MAG: glycosyltransferase family 2 protein [Sphingobacteriales bacterium]|nr:MAG: glycosyltransferase family 2 protein [Sphingobacteriales bacterium]